MIVVDVLGTYLIKYGMEWVSYYVWNKDTSPSQTAGIYSSESTYYVPST